LETDFQTIDIYDVIFEHDPRMKNHKKSLSHVGAHEADRPDRIVMLDGWFQSTLNHEAAYHEALVQPAMFAHASPNRVAIVGGGEGATLREVLKHNTVEEATMIEIDEQVVNICREHIPEWSDCNDLVQSASWCLEDPRVNVYYQDALKWILDRYSGANKSKDLFDVMVVDAL
jgi:spermidine synthase